MGTKRPATAPNSPTNAAPATLDEAGGVPAGDGTSCAADATDSRRRSHPGDCRCLVLNCADGGPVGRGAQR